MTLDEVIDEIGALSDRNQEVKPCPFCGNTMLSLRRKTHMNILYYETYVSCCYVKDMPIYEWNKRSDK